MEDRDNMETKPKGSFFNIRCYKFASIDHLEEHRQLLAEIGQLLSVTGTIILSDEGINIALSGDKSSVEQMFEACKAIPGLKNLKGYDQERLYAYLAERYLSFWFRRNTKFLEWPWVFYEEKK